MLSRFKMTQKTVTLFSKRSRISPNSVRTIEYRAYGRWKEKIDTFGHGSLVRGETIPQPMPPMTNELVPIVSTIAQSLYMLGKPSLFCFLATNWSIIFPYVFGRRKPKEKRKNNPPSHSRSDPNTVRYWIPTAVLGGSFFFEEVVMVRTLQYTY